ncbi:MAG TPA: PAS domain S-box protein [bacterium]|nr:PAS domain S-box protein [bacterium]HQL61174.1 PAS domain S-box protein [bacterium]
MEVENSMGNVENALKPEHQDLLDFLNAVQELFFVLDTKGRIVYLNTPAIRWLEYSEADLRGQPVMTLCPPEQTEEDSQNIEEILAGTRRSCSFPLVTKSGRRIPAEIRVTQGLWHGSPAILGLWKDCSQICLAEEKFQKLFHTNAALMALTSQIDDRIVDVNEAFLETLGYSRGEVVGKTGLDIGIYVNPEERDKLITTIQTGGRAQNCEIKLRTKSGAIRIGLGSGSALTVDNIPCWLAVVTDITERKQTERALRKSDEEYQELYDNAPVGYHEIDIEGRIVRVNRTEAEMLGYAREEMLGRLVTDFVAEAQREAAAEAVRLKLAGAIPTRRFERTYIRKDGEEVRVAIEENLVRDPRGRIVGIRSVLQNITELKRLEEQLRQAQKMEAIGQLAGGIAHDFNNLLTGIIGNLSLAEVLASSEIRHYLGNATVAAERAVNLVRQLLTFSRKSRIVLRTVDLNTLVEEIYHLISETIDRRIEIVVNTQENLPCILADASQINSILMNFCINARDAINMILEHQALPQRIGDQFSIEIGTQTVEIDDVYCRTHLNTQPGTYVLLTVSDNGIGMDEATRRHIFEPFFTTKEVGQGTGMGLAGAYGIIHQHGGWINFYTEYGKGTTFKIYLPAIKEESATPASTPPDDVPGGTETILLVDDEEMIRNLGQTVLESYGYTVIVAQDGKEAINLYLKNRGIIDLVILDLSMPHLSGREVLQQLRGIDADVKVIVSSGYGLNGQSENLGRIGVKYFISKPYRPMDLASEVRKVLDAG